VSQNVRAKFVLVNSIFFVQLRKTRPASITAVNDRYTAATMIKTPRSSSLGYADFAHPVFSVYNSRMSPVLAQQIQNGIRLRHALAEN